VTFGTRENFYTEHLQFEVADIETTYNAFLRRPTLTKFMAIPHYAYMVLKRPGTHGSIMGGVKRAYYNDRDSSETVGMLTTSVELQELKNALAESPPPDPIMPEAKTSKVSIQSEDSLSKSVPLFMEEPSKIAHVGNSLDPK
jgi:hypothetical protein